MHLRQELDKVELKRQVRYGKPTLKIAQCAALVFPPLRVVWT